MGATTTRGPPITGQLGSKWALDLAGVVLRQKVPSCCLCFALRVALRAALRALRVASGTWCPRIYVC